MDKQLLIIKDGDKVLFECEPMTGGEFDAKHGSEVDKTTENLKGYEIRDYIKRSAYFLYEEQFLKELQAFLQLTTEKNNSKPPLGLKPKEIWDNQRKEDIKQAISRYIEAGKDIPIEWLKELIDLQSLD